jgi:uncharacterized protein YbjT (DUF2867 family)
LRVLVTGATGTLGRVLLPRLREAGHEVRAMSRRPRAGGDVEWVQADLATGSGLPAAVADVDVIVHLASAPYRGRYTAKVDRGGTRRLVETARAAGVGHLVYVSIVGIDRVPWGYFRTKLAAEEVVKDGQVAWSILRATQFHQLLKNALKAMSRLPVLIIDPGIPVQPVDPDDVAIRLVARITHGPSNMIEEFGGPEVLDVESVLRLWLAARGLKRPILRLRLPGALGRTFRAGYLTTDARPRGRITLQDCLEKA